MAEQSLLPSDRPDAVVVAGVEEVADWLRVVTGVDCSVLVKPVEETDCWLPKLKPPPRTVLAAVVPRVNGWLEDGAVQKLHALVW